MTISTPGNAVNEMIAAVVCPAVAVAMVQLNCIVMKWMRSTDQYYEDLMLWTKKQWYNFFAVAYLYERIKHQEEIVLENEISRNAYMLQK